MSSQNTADLSSEIQQLIDTKFGDDIKSLKGIKKLYDDIVKRKEEYEEEVCFILYVIYNYYKVIQIKKMFCR